MAALIAPSRCVAREHVHEHNEHAVPRVGRHVESGALRDRVAALDVWRERGVLDEVERLNCLRLPILENLEILGGQPFEDPAVGRRGIRVDANELRPAAKHGALLRGNRRRRLLRAKQDGRDDRGEQRTHGALQ